MTSVLLVRESEKMLPETAGIYAIHDRYRKQVYIGSTFSFRDRFGKHLSKLIRKKHPNRALQSFFEKKQILYFTLLQIGQLFELTRLEKEYTEAYSDRALNAVSPRYYRRMV